MTLQIAVVGGGWAGCAAALTLAEAGMSVTLFEASRTLGGRARAIQIGNQTLDNGQHVLLGAYDQTLKLIRSLHAEPDGLWRMPLTLDQPPDFQLACPHLPAPLHLLAGLLGARGLDWNEKLAAARWAHAILRDPRGPDHLTVSEFTRTQPEKLRRLLWHPLCESALNTPPESASAMVFRNVIRAAFGGRRCNSDLLLPRRDLTALFPAPAAKRLDELGSTVRLSSRVTSIEATREAVTLLTPSGGTSFSHVILAVAPQHLASLAMRVAALEPSVRKIAAYSYQAIATAYVQYDPAFRLHKPLVALADGPAQFVFDRGQSHGQPGLLAYVASTASGLAADWMDHAEAQLRRSTQPGSSRWHKSIIEKKATYACVSDMARPAVRTAHSRIFLAGDYTAGPFPATLESATRSGVQSASALLEQL